MERSRCGIKGSHIALAETGSNSSVATNRWYLLDVYRDQIDYPDLKDKTLQLVSKWDPDRVLIDDAATGRPLFDEPFRGDRRRFKRIRPEKEKEIRFNAACAPVEPGIAYLPVDASWLPTFKRELQAEVVPVYRTGMQRF